MKADELLREVIAFRDQRVLPLESQFEAEIAEGAQRWRPSCTLEGLRAEARAAELWNLCLQEEGFGPGLSHEEYAPICEAMGWNEWLPEVFNCNPPDSGNISLLARYASDEQKARWLAPLLKGEIRSCFAMTEPDVASSDARNISMRAERTARGWRLNGRKWWISGPGNPLCKLAIVLCRTGPEEPRSRQHSMMLVPMEAPGLTVVRPLSILGIDFAPRGFCELRFEDVEVSDDDVVGEPGMGLEIAQGRLGGGRLHHAIRCVGAAERALQLMCRRGLSRTAFGKPLVSLGENETLVARSRIEINLVRALVLDTARRLDRGDPLARGQISQVKVAAPAMACGVIDRAIQIHGAAGLSQDTPLAALYARQRSLRIADGPDAAHLRVVAREELGRQAVSLEPAPN